MGCKVCRHSVLAVSGIRSAANEVRVPGGDYPGTDNKINKADIGVTEVEDFTIFFDRIGKPYTNYTSPSNNEPLAISKNDHS